MRQATNRHYFWYAVCGGVFYVSSGLTCYYLFIKQASPPAELIFLQLLSVSLLLLMFQIERKNLLKQFDSITKKLSESENEAEKIYSKNLQIAQDLDSPIAGINAVSDNLKYENKKLYELLQNSVEQIKELSTNLTSEDSSSTQKAESNFFDLENNISQLIKDKRQEFKDVKHLFIFYRVTAPILKEIKIPKTEFYRVLSNILNNSIEAMDSRAEKRIKLVISPLTNSVEILITDNGCGISEGKQKDLFQETTQDRQGQLGLSYAKNTVENWGGRIELQKSSPAGTTFRITIPSKP